MRGIVRQHRGARRRELDPRSEDDAVRAPAEVERADLLALDERLRIQPARLAIFAVVEVDGRHFGHADHDHCDQTEGCVVGLDVAHAAAGAACDVPLRPGVGGDVRLWHGLVLEVRVEAPEKGFGVVCALDNLGVVDPLAVDGRVPFVVAVGAEKSLVDAAPDELGGFGGVSQQMVERVVLVFGPERVGRLHVLLESKGRALGDAGDDGLVARGSDGALGVDVQQSRVKKASQEAKP
jgi:hypothetical protein